MGETIDEDTYIDKLTKEVERLKDTIAMLRTHIGMLNMTIETLDEMNTELSNILIQNGMFTKQELDDMYEKIWNELSEGSE